MSQVEAATIAIALETPENPRTATISHAGIGIASSARLVTVVTTANMHNFRLGIPESRAARSAPTR
jgi:hypothetical protein